jgi:hypothetical protein
MKLVEAASQDEIQTCTKLTHTIAFACTCSACTCSNHSCHQPPSLMATCVCCQGDRCVKQSTSAGSSCCCCCKKCSTSSHKQSCHGTICTAVTQLPAQQQAQSCSCCPQPPAALGRTTSHPELVRCSSCQLPPTVSPSTVWSCSSL